ncbi:MAG: DUF4982 domain-containing protein, partial [Bacteroidaceae bacterium]|nr:DUF4982 domain-containing protein [Bacteroidaceae bacterium]
IVVRDRNHPSIIMWSIGNEVLEQWSDASADTLSLEQANMILNAGHDASTLAKDGEMSINSILAKNLSDIIKNNDQGTGRLITAGCNEPDPNNHLFKSGGMDLIGFNYHHQWVRDVPKNFPGKPFIFSESVSALQTTGFYSMPSDKVSRAPKEWWMAYSDPSYKCSAYDNMHAPWSSTHEATWDVVKHNDFVCGQFIWTGWDYIGEPTPYSYPAHSSYFGIIDLAGFPKDSYYLYQSEWTNKDVLHLFPHWNWVEGQDIDLWCYYNNADEVELFINGKSQGTRKKTDNRPALKPEHTNRDVFKGSGNFDGSILNTPYHVGWRVKYTPGEVKVVAKKDGKAVREQVIKTAASPYSIRLTSNRQTLKADGTSMAFVTVEVVDKDGNLCPLAEDQIFFDVKGGAKIAGVDNGSQYTLERFKDDKRKAFFGKCLVVLQNDGSSTPVTLTAKSPMLKSASLTIGF